MERIWAQGGGLFLACCLGVFCGCGQPPNATPINYNFNYKEDITNTVNHNHLQTSKISSPTQSTTQTKQVIRLKTDEPKKVIFSQENYYPLSGREVGIEESHGKLFLDVYSYKLQKFMQGEVFLTKRQTQTFKINDSSTQITNIEGRIKTYEYSQIKQKDHSINTPYQRYALQQKTPTRFQIAIDKIPYAFDTQGCRVVIRKQLIDTFSNSKEVMINLDFKRELRNKASFDLFLECPW
ncbi:cell surface protein [Helicobacter ailurogastricus]|uniref:High molecular weight glutenin subunit x n=1 Tax=Helicobacter ailurogastricus TaxID=1578720 RepID=A0A0K2Y5C6_9HELI|nr:cell surface protein [Helicobacter ailurogastricus]GLH57738.1 hypothetical protein NHP214376_05250 [Helicobacter ailurogastricus]GLH58853.1 hypothetical protein NHP214377_01170 [Helicobacter ailurogastricus]GMB91629.1 hypothetical protein NHP190009_07980 [Helicobacter ailurogastricus]CRF53049.1 High molecular weight glutenin subunit x precursor [Helicobacter ailurogastricus]